MLARQLLLERRVLVPHVRECDQVVTKGEMPDDAVIPVLEHVDVESPNLLAFRKETASRDAVFTKTPITERFHMTDPVVDSLDLPNDRHDIDNRLRVEPGDRRTTNVMNRDEFVFEQSLELGRLFFEFRRPYRVIWDDFYFSHRPNSSFG